MEGDKKIEKYQFSLKKVLGQGSYATVYLGKCLDSDEAVAVKVIDKRIFSNAYNVKNIQSEIDIMKKVKHENIVLLYDIYQTTNNMYIVTELCQDGDLYRLLHSHKKLPELQAKKYLRQIMNGAKYLHKNGIIHRDLKPANILLKDGICKISDFGFAKSLAADETVMKSIVGTPLYMSPQILKKTKYTAKSDLWSIGLIYYEMLHGRTPWPANNEIELIKAIYHKKVAFATDVSEKSRDFIRNCLEIYQEDRMTWEDAFAHCLLADPRKPSWPLVETIVQDNSNDCELFTQISMMKTPKHCDRQANKINDPRIQERQDKSYGNTKGNDKENKSLCLNGKKKDVSGRKTKKADDCLTPKSKLTPKARNDMTCNTRVISKLRTELTAKKDKDNYTGKKKPSELHLNLSGLDIKRDIG